MLPKVILVDIIHPKTTPEETPTGPTVRIPVGATLANAEKNIISDRAELLA